MISISVNQRAHILVQFIVKLKTKRKLYAKDLASVHVTLHEFHTEAFQKRISESLWYKPRLPLALSIPMLPIEKAHNQTMSLLGRSTLPLISKTSIAGNMVSLMAALSPVLARNSSSLRISLFSIVKLYKWPKVLEPTEMLSSRGTIGERLFSFNYCS